ncbi:hypothetical protein [Acetobacter conturbans]|uniref:Uncharacterized protein n=1 Tax=Acetobacter conturbans TaxID=1737472 RepID=A0ABX0K4B2_9PROT|nr:hypothetical protein [Acetobacter conturbans]NHN89455.1 hypothetical protein [Acetobacter conturbans]
MRLATAFVDQPRQLRRIAVGGVGGQILSGASPTSVVLTYAVFRFCSFLTHTLDHSGDIRDKNYPDRCTQQA